MNQRKSCQRADDCTNSAVVSHVIGLLSHSSPDEPGSHDEERNPAEKPVDDEGLAVHGEFTHARHARGTGLEDMVNLAESTLRITDHLRRCFHPADRVADDSIYC